MTEDAPPFQCISIISMSRTMMVTYSYEHNLTTRPSVEDRKLVTLMNAEFHKNADGYWSAPLPFKESKPKMPNNHLQAWKRALILNTCLKKRHTN